MVVLKVENLDGVIGMVPLAKKVVGVMGADVMIVEIKEGLTLLLVITVVDVQAFLAVALLEQTP